jgi:hypothetical protein
VKKSGWIVRKSDALYAQSAPPATLRTAVVGQVFVIEDSNGTLLTGKSGEDSIKWELAYQYFLQTYGDDYDFVAMIPDLDSRMPSTGNFSETIFNNVAGINRSGDDREYFDDRADYGTIRLQSYVGLMPPKSGDNLSLRRWARLHELAHRWCAHVCFKTSATDPVKHADLLSGDSHWGHAFDKHFSPMHGPDPTYWRQNDVDGSFTEESINPDEYAYCPLDLYLMGMFAPSEVGSFYYIDGLKKEPTVADPFRNVGTRVDLTVQNIIWAHGPRQPDAANSPRSFRQAFIVLTNDIGSGMTLAATLDNERITLAREFRSVTLSRSVLDTYLYADSYDSIYMKDNDFDTGTEPSVGTFWNSPDIWVRNDNDGGTDHQDTIRDRDNYIYVRVRNKGAQACDEITVNVFQSNWPGTEFLYPEDWIWDDDHLVGSKTILSIPAGRDAVVSFLWDKNRIASAAGWHPCLLTEILPIHRTQTKLRHVWEDRRIAQKNVTIVEPPAAGEPLIFQFSIGARSVPVRWVRIRIEQTEGEPVGEVKLDLGREDWLGRLDTVSHLRCSWVDVETVRSKGLNALARGGEVIGREGLSYFVISDIAEGGDIALPLLEADRPTLTLELHWGETLPTDARFEITQLNDQNEIVGGLDLVVRRRGEPRPLLSRHAARPQSRRSTRIVCEVRPLPRGGELR